MAQQTATGDPGMAFYVISSFVPGKIPGTARRGEKNEKNNTLLIAWLRAGPGLRRVAGYLAGSSSREDRIRVPEFFDLCRGTLPQKRNGIRAPSWGDLVGCSFRRDSKLLDPQTTWSLLLTPRKRGHAPNVNFGESDQPFFKGP